MTDRAPDEFIRALDKLPTGTTRGSSDGLRYLATKTIFNAGRSVKLVAEQLGGTNYISLNFYALRTGGRIHPCEMSREKVIHFVLSFQPGAPRSQPPSGP